MSGLIGGILNVAGGGLWKYATIGVGAIGLISSAGLGIDLALKTRDLNQVNSKLTQIITQKALADANNATLLASIVAQNEQIDAASKDSKTKLAAAATTIQTYQSVNGSLQKQVATIMARPIAGKNTCERMDDVDSTVLGDLK